MDRPVSYSVIQNQFSSAVADCNIHTARAGAPHEVVQKAMRVKSKSMVAYYATLKGKDLAKVSKLAF